MYDDDAPTPDIRGTSSWASGVPERLGSAEESSCQDQGYSIAHDVAFAAQARLVYVYFCHTRMLFQSNIVFYMRQFIMKNFIGNLFLLFIIHSALLRFGP